MTKIVPISLLPCSEAAFSSDVHAYVSAVNEWIAHMERVKADEAAGLAHDDERKHAAYPAPQPSIELIKECCRLEDGGFAVADYKIEYPPGPTPEEAFKEKQRVLAQQVGLAEQAALNEVMHPLKRRLHAHRVGEAQMVPEDQRTAEHQALLTAHAAQQQRYRANAVHAATLEAEIADLTADTVDHWKPAPFPA